VSRKIHAIYASYLGLYLLGFVVTPIFVPVRDFGMMAIAVLPAILILRSGLLHQRFWRTMAAAHVAWGIGQAMWVAKQPAIQDSAYWLFKLLLLGAILYRPFYGGTETNRRLHVVDTTLALSLIAYYVGYFFIIPSIVHQQLTRTFYASAANVLLNVGIAITAIFIAWQARNSVWRDSYRLIATGLGLYTAASLSYLTFGMPYTDPFWCSAFWALAQAINFAPKGTAKPIDAVIVPSRYGLSMVLVAAVAGIHLVTSLFSTASHQLQDVRGLLTLCQVIALMVLLHFRLRIVVQESELRHHQLEVSLNSLAQPIYIVDGQYNLVLANDVFRNRFRTTGGTCYAVVFGRKSPCEWCQLSQSRPFSLAVDIQETSYQLEFAPMAVGQGAKGGVETLVDITGERRRSQQLIQTERMAALGRMIAGTAHELNNPLAIVLGNAHLLRDSSSLSYEGRRQVAAIASAAERARDIVQTFLTLSRPGDSDKTLVDVVDVIRSVQHLKVSELNTYGIDIDVDLPESLPTMGRYTLLQEVLLNLLDNARDAIRQAKRQRGLIVIHGRRIRGERIKIEVSDNGAGILRENRDRVFDPFFSTKDVGQGTGLGLSIVHSIVSDHGGNIQVESDGQSFTRFEMDFPLFCVPANVVPSSSRATNVLRILAVDDEPEILNILENSLGQMGHHVECTTTGSRALQLLSKNKFDVLLLDMHLPEMDGTRIIKRLETMIPPVSVRTIVITGDTISEDIRKFAADHSLPLVMKPVDIDQLNQLLQDTAAAD
jgi:signal transduction histidine kinase/CheY-like chemotaxis protein